MALIWRVGLALLAQAAGDEEWFIDPVPPEQKAFAAQMVLLLMFVGGAGSLAALHVYFRERAKRERRLRALQAEHAPDDSRAAQTRSDVKEAGTPRAPQPEAPADADEEHFA